MPAIFPTYTPLKHLSNLLLVTVLYAILVINLFPNYLCNPGLCISSRLCPRLVTLEDLILLFVRLINVFFSLGKPLLCVLFRKRAFSPGDPPDKPLLLKCCTYCLLSTLKSKDCGDLKLRRLAVLLRGCNPLN